MSISITPLLKDFKLISNKLNNEKKELTLFESEVDFTRNLKERIQRELQENNKLDWREDPNRALLDRLYDQEPFQFYERIYYFKNQQKALPLLQDLDQYFNEQTNQLNMKQQVVSKNESDLKAYHQEILQIISQLSHCMSIVNR